MPAQILCPRCGNSSPTAAAVCVKCGGKNARVCGDCGMQNSVVKNFCDKCGSSISEITGAPPPPQRLPGSPEGDIPATVIKRLPGGPPPAGRAYTPGEGLEPPIPSPAEKPLPAGSQNPGLDDLWSKPAPLVSDAPPTIERQRPYPLWRRAAGTAAALIGLLGAAYGIWMYRELHSPEIVVPKLAAEYLDALKARDFARAYAMFSAEARQHCTEDEFRASRDATPWTWSDLRITHQEPNAMLLSYQLHVQGAEPRKDHVLFTRENERWTRPYNWVVMRKVEAAFAKGDPSEGLKLAQIAATINPRDPMAWGYLCEAAYFRRAAAETEDQCLRAIALARTYPSNLTLKSLYHLHAILADTYNVSLKKPEKAVEQFAQMLAFPDISPADQCQLLLARAQAYVEISRPGEALADLNRGAQLCAGQKDLEFIQTLRGRLSLPE